MIAERVRGITPFLAMEVLERAQKLEREGASIIHLELGEPDFDTPECIRQAAFKALDEGQTHYTHSLGDVELREHLCAYYKRRYGVSLHPDQVLIFPGSSPAMMILFSALLDPGDEVILSNPGYACYPNFVRYAGGVPVWTLTHEEEGFQFRPEDVAKQITPRTRAVLINSPCNPTGIVLEPERMRALAELGPMIVSDEIYHGLTYGDAEEHSILEYTDNAVVIGGFSKAYAMTGWRLGYLIVPRDLVRPMQALMQNFFLSTNSAVQKAGIAALTCADEDVARMHATYDERRRFLLGELKRLGFNIPVEPMGAFYMLINARHLGSSSMELAFDLLEKAHIGITPGIDFGSQTEGFLRLSYANSIDNLAEAMRRLEHPPALALWRKRGKECPFPCFLPARPAPSSHVVTVPVLTGYGFFSAPRPSPTMARSLAQHIFRHLFSLRAGEDMLTSNTPDRGIKGEALWPKRRSSISSIWKNVTAAKIRMFLPFRASILPSTKETSSVSSARAVPARARSSAASTCWNVPRAVPSFSKARTCAVCRRASCALPGVPWA